MEKWATNSFHLTNDKIKSWKANNTDTSRLSYINIQKHFKKRKKGEEETLLLALVIQSGTRSILE